MLEMPLQEPRLVPVDSAVGIDIEIHMKLSNQE